MRLLAYIRLSRDTDVSNSPATQRADIEDWAQERGHEIIGWAQDLDVSGGIPIAQREGIGPWFAPDMITTWTAVCGHQVDRLFRDARDFFNTARDLRDQNQRWIIDVSDGTDTSTTRGMQILEDRAIAAERERIRMSERRARAAKRIRGDGRWNGGLAPFGWMPEPIYRSDDDTEPVWRLVHDPTHALILRRMADDLLGGRSLNYITTWLNAEGVPTATDLAHQRNPKRKSRRGAGWKPQSVRAILRCRAMTGMTTSRGEVVRGPDGLPQRFGEPITWKRLGQILNASAGRLTGPRISRLLLRVAYCARCGRPMYGKSTPTRRQVLQASTTTAPVRRWREAEPTGAPR